MVDLPVSTGIDEQIDFEWESFITATGKITFLYDGQGFKTQFSETYTFTVEVNGAKLWVNNEVLVDEFESSTPENSDYSTYTGTTSSTCCGPLV